MAKANEQVQEFLAHPIVNRYLDGIAKDSDSALATAKANLAYVGMKFYPSTLLKTYKLDRSRCDKAHGDFNLAFNKVANGISNDLKDLEAAYSKHVLALEVLERQNSDHSALIKANFAVIASQLALLFVPFSPIAVRMRDAEARWQKILKELNRAKKDARDAKVQAALNVAIGVVVTIIAPQTLIGRLVLVAGSTAVSVAINECMGSRGVGPLGASVSTVKGAVKASGKLKGGTAKAAGAVGTAATLLVDLSEIKDADRRAKLLLKEVKTAEKETKKATEDFEKLAKAVEAKNKEFENAHSKALSALGKHSSKQAERRKLLKEFKKWK